MTDVVKVTSKGQITLPIAIRDSIAVNKGSYLIVEQVGDYILMKKADIRMKEIRKILGEAAKKKGITKKALLYALEKERAVA